MTKIEFILKLLSDLNEIQGQLANANVGERSQRRLRILAMELQLEIEEQAAGLLKPLPDEAIPDVANLRQLTEELKQEVTNQQKRAELVRRVITTARTVLGKVLPV